jgi:hypothetical protein
MVAMFGKALRCLMLHAVLSLMVTLTSLRNAIRCGSATIPSSEIEAFAHVVSSVRLRPDDGAALVREGYVTDFVAMPH